MKTSHILSAASALLSTAVLLATAPSAKATEPLFPDLQYNVTLNLSSLVGNDNGAFSLDFQLITGSGNVANQVTLSNFTFTGGSPSGTPDFTNGSETGSMLSTIVLTNGTADNGDNEIAEALAAGMTSISFHVNETPNSELVTSGTPVSDQFNVAILDNGLNNIPTTDPSGGNTLVASALGETSTLGTVDTYSSLSPDGGVSVTLATPEPNSAALSLLAGGGMLGLLLMRRRRVA